MTLVRSFQALFGRHPVVTAHACGRVNLLGEHTDYNGGYVLPTAVPYRTVVELAPRPDRLVRAWSANLPTAEVAPYRLGQEAPEGRWTDYVQGVTHRLLCEGHDFSGFDLRVTSSIPLGRGFASSAALGISLLRGLRAAFGLPLEDAQLALLGQRAEQSAGTPVGIMDPLACSLADDQTALFLDTRSRQWQRVPLPAEAELVILHSGLAHDHRRGDYDRRRAECEQAAALLQVPQLRDLKPADLDRLAGLPAPLARRARHVLSENHRVLRAVQAMRAGDLQRLGALLDASHQSLRDDYEGSLPDIDLLVELAQAESSVYGARLTGRGFGGPVVALVRRGDGKRVAKRLAQRYTECTGRLPTVLLPTSRRFVSLPPLPSPAFSGGEGR